MQTTVDSKLLENIYGDIERSILQPLLLEINQQELADIQKDLSVNGIDESINSIVKVAIDIYDKSLHEKKIYNQSNVIYIDQPENYETPILFEATINKIDEKIKSSLNLDIGKNIIKGSIVTLFKMFGGDIIDIATMGKASVAIKGGSNLLVDGSAGLLDILFENTIDTTSTLLQNQMESVFEFISSSSAEELVDIVNINIGDALFLSKNGINHLKHYHEKFDEVSFIEAFQIMLRLLLAISIDAPKLIIVKNPQHLDLISLTIISMFFTLAKDHRSKNFGLSFMFIYDKKHSKPGFPYTKEQLGHISDEEQKSKIFLDNQRLFLQRYGMLEQPISDLPVMAVSSDIFVGRLKERELLKKRSEDFLQKKSFTIDVIQAEPGVGKTALYHQHIRDVFENDLLDKDSLYNRNLVVKLSIYNDNSINGATGGLSSLMDSIEHEYKRLEQYYLSHYKISSSLKKLGKEGIKTLTLNAIFSGLNEIKDIGQSIFKRYQVDTRNATFKNSLVSGKSKEERKKEEVLYFSDILNKISILFKVIEKIEPNFPHSLMLFIDDVHWIDEESTKFLITYLFKNYNVRIIATARISDSNSYYLSKAKSINDHAYTLAFFEKFKLVKKDLLIPDNDKVNQIKKQFPSKNIVTHMIGDMDSKLLSELLSEVIHNSNDYKSSYLADAIIDFLKDDTSSDHSVVTLFAIETINIICDPKFYTEDLPAIIKEEKGIYLYIDLNKDMFEMYVKKIFVSLHKNMKESASLLVGNTSQEDNITISMGSFAILEERLKLIAIHFGEERGNALVQHFLFTSLMGSPFDKNIVQETINVLMEENDPLLIPFQNKLLKQIKVYNDFDTLEYVYQMVHQLVANQKRYAYKHALLEVFLEQKMDALINECYANNKDILNEAKSKIYQIVFDYYNNTLSNENVDYDSNYLSDEEKEEFLYILRILERISRKAYQIDNQFWLNTYIEILHKLASAEKLHEKSLNLRLQAFDILKKNYMKDSEKWVSEYIETITNLSYSYEAYSQEFLELQKEYFDIVESKYMINPEEWSFHYMEAQEGLSKYYSYFDEDQSLRLAKNNYDIVQKLYEKEPEVWNSKYSIVVQELATRYQEKNNFKLAIEFQTDSYLVAKQLYKKDNEWIYQYIESSNNLAILYSNVDVNKAINIFTDLYKIVEPLYLSNESQWKFWYIHIKNKLALSYMKTSDMDHALKLLEENLRVIEKYYALDNPTWIDNYLVNLANFVHVYEELGEYDQAILLQLRRIELHTTTYKYIDTYNEEHIDTYNEEHIEMLKELSLLYKKIENTRYYITTKIKYSKLIVFEKLKILLLFMALFLFIYIFYKYTELVSDYIFSFLNDSFLSKIFYILFLSGSAILLLSILMGGATLLYNYIEKRKIYKSY